MEGQPPADIPGVPPPLARVSDKFPLSASRFVRTGILAVILAFGLALVLVLVNEVTRRDTPEDFAKLCQIVLEPTAVVSPPQVLPSEAEATLASRRLMAELPRISRRDRKLAPVAREYALILRRQEQVARQAPNLASGLLGAGEALIGLYAGERGMVGEGALKALKEGAKAAEAYPQIMDLWVQRHVAAVELAELAPLFSAAPTQGAPIEVRFGEHPPGFWGIETIEAAFLTNGSGRELRNCVIELRTIDQAGASFLRVHFARSWPAGQMLAVGYSSTEPAVPRFDPVAGVEIRVLSQDLSTGWARQNRPRQGWQQF